MNTYPSTDIDKISVQLSEEAGAFAKNAENLAHDPYFRQAVVKCAVSAFVWRLYDAFNDDFGRAALLSELIDQTEAIRRAVDVKQLN